MLVWGLTQHLNPSTNIQKRKALAETLYEKRPSCHEHPFQKKKAHGCLY